MTARANIRTILDVRANDKASRAIKGVRRQLGSLGQAARSALAGDFAGAAESVSAALGPGAGVAGTAAAATAGVAAFGVAAVAAAVKISRATEQIERFRVQARAAFEGGEQAALRFADAVGGVNVRSVVEFRSQLRAAGIDTQFTARELQNLTNTAARVGKTGDEALTALAQAIRTGSTRALNSVGVFINAGRVQDAYAKQLGKTTTELTALERQQAVVDELQRKLQRDVAASNTVWAEQDQQLARLDNNYERIKLAISEAFSEKAIGVVYMLNGIIDEQTGLAEERRKAADANREATLELNRAYLATVDEGLYEMLRASKAVAMAMGKTSGEASQFRTELVSLLRTTEDTARGVADSIDDVTGRLAGAFKLLGRASGLTMAFDAVTGDTAALDKIRKARERERARRRRRATRTARPEQEMGGGAADDAVGFGEPIEFMLAQEARARAELTEQKRKEAEATLALADAQRQMDLALRDNLDRLVEEAKRIDEKREAEKRASGQTVEGYTAAGLAIAGTIAAQVKNERAANGLRAAIETAQSLSNAGKFAATGNPGFLAASISHGAAAAIYAKNALGGGGSRGGGGGRAASGGGAAAGTPGGGGEGGGETTINVNFPGFVVGREADVAKQLKSLTAPLAGTGYGT
jgi:hypothetical protein